MSLPECRWLKTTFGTRWTYERVLPDLVEEHAHGSLTQGSAFGGEDNNSYRTIGDVHIWNLSSRILVPYQVYPDLVARFASEFGIISPIRELRIRNSFTLRRTTATRSEAFEHYRKASRYDKRLFTCIGEKFLLSFNLQTYVYLTQLFPSEAMWSAFRGWRRRFEDRFCGVALVWQVLFILNP